MVPSKGASSLKLGAAVGCFHGCLAPRTGEEKKQ